MRKWIKRLALCLMGLIAVVAVLWVVLYFHGRSKLNAELAHWRDRGVEFNSEYSLGQPSGIEEDERLAQLNALYDQLPDQYKDAFINLENASAGDLAEAVDASRNIYELVHRIAREPTEPLGESVGQGPELLAYSLPQFGAYRKISRLLGAEAIVNVRRGDYEAADRSIASGFAIARQSGRDDLLICLLVEVSITQNMINRIESLYHHSGLPDALVDDLEAICLEDRLPDVLIAEAKYGMVVADSTNSPWMNYDWAYTLRSYGKLIEAVESGSTPLRELSLGEAPPWWTPIANLNASAWRDLFKTMLRIQTRIELAKTAIRLRQYKTERGAYPTGLDDLTGLPTDPHTGGAFDYRLDGDGFVLTSSGNQADGAPIGWRWEK